MPSFMGRFHVDDDEAVWELGAPPRRDLTAPRPHPGPPAPRRTYAHLGRGRVPTEYEIATSNLLYHVGRGFEVNVPIAAWYQRYQAGSPLGGVDWERFRDPRETTYALYTKLQRTGEAYIDGALQTIERTGSDRALAPAWVEVLARAVAPLCYPLHGLQMVAAYVGQMAPGGRVTVVAALQAADEVRAIQRVAYRTAQLARTHPGFGDDSRPRWQADPLWQPLREAVERLLVAYDWGEALVGLDVCVKPVVDELFLVLLPGLAALRGDPHLGAIFGWLAEDARWQRSFTRALLATIVEQRPELHAPLARWTATWMPRALAAARPFASLWGDGAARLEGEIDAFARGWVASLGLEDALP